MLANAGPFGQPELLTTLAPTAEEAGVESLWTVEHVVDPERYESAYPYGRGSRMPGPEEAPIPDPFVGLAYAVARASSAVSGSNPVSRSNFSKQLQVWPAPPSSARPAVVA